METRKAWGARPGPEHSSLNLAASSVVREIFSQLGGGPGVSRSLEKKIGATAAAELKELSQEKDPAMIFEGMLLLGRRWEAEGKADAAANLYAAIAQDRNRPLPGEIQRRAQAQLDALTGGGPFGLRAEAMLRDFSKTATDYRIIVPMMAGSAVYQIAKTAAWSRLLASPLALPVTRGLGARVTAAFGAYALEVPTFALLNRSLGAGSQQPLWQDLARSAITLGALKVSNAVGAKFVTPATGVAGLPTTLSAYLGLLGAHYLEVQWGLRPFQERGAVFTETLASLIGLGVGARLGAGLLGPKWSGFQRELTYRETAMRKTQGPGGFLPGMETTRQRAFALQAPGGEPFPGPTILMSTGSTWDRLIRILGERFPSIAEHAETKSEPIVLPAGAVTAKDDYRMKLVFKKYPKLKRAMDKAAFNPAQKRDLLNLVVAHAEEDSSDALEQLGTALKSMVDGGFTYEKITAMLTMLGEEDGSYSLKIKQISSAMAAVRRYKISEDDKFKILMDLGQRAGPHADQVYANLYHPLKILDWNGWPLQEQASAMLGGMIAGAGGQIGIVLANFHEAYKVTLEEIWDYRDKIHFYSLLALRTSEDHLMEARLKEGFPLSMEEMKKSRLESGERLALFTQLMEQTAPRFDDALELFPGNLQFFRTHGWPKNLVVGLFSDVIRRAGPHSDRILKWMPSLANTMRAKGWELTTQRDVILDLAEYVRTMDDYALLGLVHGLLRGPRLNEKKN